MRSLVLWAALALVVSGCTEVASTTPLDTAASSAAAPSVSADAGSIQGFVFDDEQLPLAGAEVYLQELARTTQTDASGAYTLNDIVPGTHAIFAQRAGYDQVGVKVQVVPGEVVWRNFTLKPFSLVVPYTDVVPRTAFIDLGQFQLDTLILKGLNQTCKSCKFPFLLDVAPMGFMGEYVFRLATPAPPGYEKIGFHLYRNYTGDDPYHHQAECLAQGCATYIDANYLPDHGQYKLGAGQLKRPTDQITWYVTSSQFGNYQQKLDIWFSVAHHAELPDGYTAAPPK
jgi:hypothetical protein